MEHLVAGSLSAENKENFPSKPMLMIENPRSLVVEAAAKPAIPLRSPLGTPADSQEYESGFGKTLFA
jgi:hypothetical protein